MTLDMEKPPVSMDPMTTSFLAFGALMKPTRKSVRDWIEVF